MSKNRTLFILGRQPALGFAELESVFGATNVHPVGSEAAILDVAPEDVDLGRFGGSVKLCVVLGVFETAKWPELQQEVNRELPPLIAETPEGKLQLGISTYGLPVRPQQLLAAGLNLKKALRSAGRSVRLIPNQTNALNSAQVLHNHLTGLTGFELVLVRDGNQTIYAKTLAEQDIESYTVRDRGRPRRDARVGMLPPKLAQILINLAGGSVNPSHTRLLDPFCGTGVVLQEALLLGYDAYGTDLEPRMIDYSQANLEWFQNQFGFSGSYDLSPGDATTFHWQPPIDRVACETYLGQPFNTFPTPDKLEQVRKTCNTIIEKFLTNIANQMSVDARLCIAVPAWQQKPNQFVHLPALDHLEKLGYNRVSFEHARDQELIYSRDDQVVARELLVITRK
jgi:tRNA G10  N-methylase Trm11